MQRSVRRRSAATAASTNRLLLDTHTFLWFVSGSGQLSAVARTAIEDPVNAVFVSAASAWEISIKRALGKLTDATRFHPTLAEYLRRHGYTELAIVATHGEMAGDLPLLHRDPFDRMLIAQALAEEMVLVSNDTVFDEYGVPRIW